MMVNQPPTLRNLWKTFKEKEKEAKAREAMFARRQRGKKKRGRRRRVVSKVPVGTRWNFIRSFLGKTGNILPRRKTGISKQEHQLMVNYIKRARHAKKLPFLYSKY